MFSLDAPLQPSIDGFVDPENGEAMHTTHLNNVIMQVHRKVPIEQVVQLLGVHLTHTQDKRRGRATLLLAEVLTRLPDLRLSADTARLLLTFFLERLKDGPSMAACLKALVALISLHPKLITPADAWTVAETLLALPTPIASLSQSMRKACFEVLRLVVRGGTLGDHEARLLMEGFLKAMHGEKDPRNLLLCLQFSAELLTTFGTQVDGDVAKAFFDTTSCYFPITFRPPPNDPYGITSEDLVAALRGVFVAHDGLAKHVLPMVLDKLQRTTVAEMTKDILETIAFCCTKYPLNRLLLHFQPVAAAVYHHVLHGENTGIITTALAALKTITRAVSPPSKLPGMQALAWTKCIVFLVHKALEDLSQNAPDSMISAGAGSVLVAIASVGATGFSFVLSTALELLLAQCTAAPGSPAEAATARLVQLLDCIDTEVDHSVPPLVPYVGAIQATLLASLAAASSSRQQTLCLQGLRCLVLRPPSPLVDDASLQTLLHVWTSAVLANPHADVRTEATSGLQAIALKSPALAQQVLTRCMPILLRVLEQPEASTVSNRSAEMMVQDVLAVLTQLSVEPSIFVALLLPLCQLSWTHTFAADVMAAAAQIVVVNKDKVSCMDYCVLGDGAEASVLSRLVTALVGHVHASGVDVAPFVAATATIAAMVMQYGSLDAQTALLSQTLGLFLSADVSPLRSKNTALLPLLVAVLYSAGAALPALDAAVLPQMLPLLLAIAADERVAKALGALFNVLPDDSPLLHTYMKWLTTPSAPPLEGFVSPAALLVDVAAPPAARLAALQTYVYVCKAMVLRGHATFAPAMLSFLCQQLATPTFDLRAAVAQSFATLVRDDADVLTPACHATISCVHRQRTFAHVFPLLFSPSADAEARVAIMLVVSHTPQAILIPSLADIAPLVVMALTESGLLGHSALATFKMCLEHDPTLVQGFFKDVFNGLLWQTQFGQSARDRMDALECIGALSSTKYELIHPYKELVIKRLLAPLDDRKRVVRQLAVKVRNTWAIL
ncbi:MMS19 nucleotide excision repair protein [Achlya hypogyna]|uniref:MMS19 nucleotide excision repair protein n=1 Tax=Achlya hypogyna TaxID=1202772 RepID=A0A1V9ZU67_ACHHY|nr:MMS19 nucleotide excision repair protein [Achlya hypogyna]